MKKGWKEVESRRREWSFRRTGNCTESPERMPSRSPARKQARSPARKQARSPERMPARSPARKQARSPARKQAQNPEWMPAQSPERKQAQSPERMPAQSPERKQARSPEMMPAQSPERKHALNLEKPIHSKNSDKLVQKEEVHCKNEEFQYSDYLKSFIASDTSNTQTNFDIVFLDTFPDVAASYQSKDKDLFKSLIASDSSNSQTSFDTVFLDTFPDVAANYQSRDKELSERERIAFCPVNTSQQNEELKRNVTAQHQLSGDPLEVCSDNDVACYQAIRSS